MAPRDFEIFPASVDLLCSLLSMLIDFTAAILILCSSLALCTYQGCMQQFIMMVGTLSFMKLTSLTFEIELIPVKQMLEKYGDSHFSTVYFWLYFVCYCNYSLNVIIDIHTGHRIRCKILEIKTHLRTQSVVFRSVPTNICAMFPQNTW